MLKSILVFGLTRRAIVLLGLLVFVAAGLVAFSKLNIEAYPNPAPVILEITAQAAGLSADARAWFQETINLEPSRAGSQIALARLAAFLGFTDAAGGTIQVQSAGHARPCRSSRSMCWRKRTDSV